MSEVESELVGLAEPKSLRIEGLVRIRTADGRSLYNEAQKRMLIALCDRPGVSIAKAAVDNGVNTNLLHKWIRWSKRARSKTAKRTAVPDRRLLAVTLAPEQIKRPLASPALASSVEVRLARGTLHIGSIDRTMLSALIDVLAQPT